MPRIELAWEEMTLQRDPLKCISEAINGSSEALLSLEVDPVLAASFVPSVYPFPFPDLLVCAGSEDVAAATVGPQRGTFLGLEGLKLPVTLLPFLFIYFY